jgi:hypothetical protein
MTNDNKQKVTLGQAFGKSMSIASAHRTLHGGVLVVVSEGDSTIPRRDVEPAVLLEAEKVAQETIPPEAPTVYIMRGRSAISDLDMYPTKTTPSKFADPSKFKGHARQNNNPWWTGLPKKKKRK